MIQNSTRAQPLVAYTAQHVICFYYSLCMADPSHISSSVERSFSIMTNSPKRNRRRIIIVDSSSSSNDSSDEAASNVGDDSVETNLVRTGPSGRASQTNDRQQQYSSKPYDDVGLSDSSSSLEGYIRSLKLVDSKEAENKNDKQDLPRGAEMNDAVSKSSKEVKDRRSSLDQNNEFEKEESDMISAWSFDRRHDEYFLCSKAVPNVPWPDLRVPADLFRNLFPHQKVAVQWMASLHENGIGGCLADDMGMGKTRMVLTYLGGMLRSHTIRNALIIAPKSVLRSWESEARQIIKNCCVPSLRIKVIASEQSRNQRFGALQEALEW